MERYLSKFRKNLIKKMNENNWNITQLAIICDCSYHGMCSIVNGNFHDINFSTFVKICENAHISYNDVFEIESPDSLEKEMQKFYITNGKIKFKLKKV